MLIPAAFGLWLLYLSAKPSRQDQGSFGGVGRILILFFIAWALAFS